MTLFLALAALLCVVPPAILFFLNLREYLPPPPVGIAELPAISVLIPARNEAQGIAIAVRTVLENVGVAFEVIVMDDASTDATAQIVADLATQDPRVRLEHAPPLPAGWNGKQHACWALAKAARNPVLCFMDADVRLEGECLARMAAFLGSSQSSLVSGFPQQLTGTLLEWLLLPLIHFVLLGFLPLSRMRAGTDPAFAAGCGQFLMVRSEDYFAAGGHPEIKETMHDGLRLPALMRAHGFRTDLADITELATCRMYNTASQVWLGLAKNATEGLAAPSRIVPVTLLLLLGQVVPFLLFASTALGFVLTAFMSVVGADVSMNDPLASKIAFVVSLVCIAIVLSVRLAAAVRFRQDWRSAVLHPLGIGVLLAIQWHAFVRKRMGGPVSWKDRAYAKQ